MISLISRPPALALSWLGKYRDGFLVLGAIIYGLGYAVWAYYAWDNNLGPLPVLEFQYLVAGLPVLAVVVVVYFVVQSSQWARKWVRESEWVWPVFWLWVGSVAACLTIFLELVLNVPRWTVYASIISFALLSFLVRLTELDETAQSTNWRKVGISLYNVFARGLHFLGNAYFWLFLFIFPLLALFDYAETYFSRIPQEWGGAAPRCAYLDVDTSRLSMASQAALSLGAALEAGEMIRRTGEVNILYAGDRSILVRIGETESPPIEIDRESITAIQACAP